ncbi:ESCRT-III subunit protein snf7 [Ceratobasidium sp. UAMH 11750]|nr:ESCRT-III subunit protein snf7 [Ceratobasidium sp. UAMH 11750]
MSGWMSYFAGKKDSRATAREAIVTTRQHLVVLDKKEEDLQRKIEEEMKKAKANAVNNKAAATAALRRKKMHEAELEKLYGQRMTLETQLYAIENANLNAETMARMKQGAQALRDIHGDLYVIVHCPRSVHVFASIATVRMRPSKDLVLTALSFPRTIDKVEATMDRVRDQMELTKEITDAISNPLGISGVDIDEDELKNELAELEHEELNDRLMGADRAPVHTPAVTAGPSTVSAGRSKEEEEDIEERELRELQAALAS